eukprot:scaffold9332_cov113-Isochrysis_galbana.AAC.1
MINGTLVFTIDGCKVCASFWRAACDVPPSTFDNMCRAVLRGDRAWKADEAALRAEVRARAQERRVTGMM